MIPIGFCQCGCGQQTPIAQKNHGKTRAGQPTVYLKNHNPAYIPLRKANKKRSILERRKFIHEYFKTHPCVDCGESDPRVLDLDHRNPEEKIGSLADLITRKQAPWLQIKTEVAKCDVRCANCHRRKHYQELSS